MTIVPILWYRPNKDKEYFVKIRLTDNKKVSYVNLNISIAKRFWYKDRITNQHPESGRLNDLISQTIQELKTRHENAAIAPASQKEVKKKPSIKKNPNLSYPDKTVGSILDTFITEFASNGKIGSAKKHKVILNHLIGAKLDMVGLEEFNSNHINKFRAYLIDKGVQASGRHTYEKVIKKVFNRAIEKGFRSTHHPFLGLRNKVPKAKPPRYLPAIKLHQMEEHLIYRRLKTGIQEIAMSMYLFSTYSYGMRFGDVVTLRWNNIRDLTIAYNMRKTQHDVIIKLTSKHANLIKTFLPEDIYPPIYKDNKDCYQELKSAGLTEIHPIIDLERNYYQWKMESAKRILQLPDQERSYKNLKVNQVLNEEEIISFTETLKLRDKELLRLMDIQSRRSSDYIFPLLPNEKRTLTYEYNLVSSKNVIINRELKTIATMINVAPFSFHSARHSFANNIRDVEPDILKISRMLGHHSLSQTQDYLKRFERTDEYESNERFIGLHDHLFLF
jgi:integrase